MEIKSKHTGMSIFDQSAGIISFWHRRWTIHVGVRFAHWRWGWRETWFDGPFYVFGIGPLLLICFMGGYYDED